VINLGACSVSAKKKNKKKNDINNKLVYYTGAITGDDDNNERGKLRNVSYHDAFSTAASYRRWIVTVLFLYGSHHGTTDHR
jgi:hypothetical protein